MTTQEYTALEELYGAHDYRPLDLVLDRPARPNCEALKERGVHCKETHDCVIRIAPPLVITKAEIDCALERIEDVLTTLKPVAGIFIAEKELVWQE